MDTLDAGRAPEALKEFEEIHNIAPVLRIAGIGKALSLVHLGRIADAVRFLSTFVAANPDYEDARTLQMRVLCGSDPNRPLFQKAAEYAGRSPENGEVKQIVCGSSFQSRVTVSIVNSVFLQGPYGLLVVDGDIKFWESTVWENVDEAFVPVLERSTFNKPVFRAGEYIALYGVWSDAFYHWMMEWVPKIVMAEAAGFKGTYVIGKSRPFFRQSLELLGVSESRILEFDGNDWIAEKLWIPESIPGNHVDTFPGVFEQMRTLLMRGVGLSADYDSGKKIYLSRRNEKRPRRVLNEKELMSAAAPFGFEEVDTESLSLAEQIRVFSGAKAVMGPSGAGLVHALFMQPRSTIIELFGPGYVNPVAYRFAEVFKHRYFMIPSYQNQEIYKFADSGNFNAFVEIVRITLQNEFTRVTKS